MFVDTVESVANMRRLSEIVGVFARYGFGDQVRRVGFAHLLEKTGRALHWRDPEELARLEPAARVRRALEDLGPTFVKLGQILATRVDLLPPSWIDEFCKLQDSAPVVPYSALSEQIVEDLGSPPEVVFAAFDPEPIAAASLAQVYRATLHDGTRVILKVRRPRIRKVVEADIRLLAHIAEVAEARVPAVRRYHPVEVVQRFARSMRNELDFSAECKNAERIARSFANTNWILVPKVHWEWVCERLNVQDEVLGVPGRDLECIESAGLDRKILANRGARAVLKMMLEDGFFHADPHPGNVFYLTGNRIAFIDFGMVGRLSETRRLQVVTLIQGMVGEDAASTADVLQDWNQSGAVLSNAQVDRLTEDIESFTDRYKGVPLNELRFNEMLFDFFNVLREYDLSIPPDLALLVKSFVTLEGLGRQLDPNFNMSATAAPFLRRAALSSLAPDRLLREGQRALTGAASFARGLPRNLRQLLRMVRQGKLHIEVELQPLERFGQKIDRAASRVALAIVTSAMIIGLALIARNVESHLWPALSTIAIVAFFGAIVGGIWLLISILRSGSEDGKK